MTHFIKLTLRDGRCTFVNLSHIVRVIERETEDGCYLDVTNSPESFVVVKETFADVMRRIRQKTNPNPLSDIHE